MWHTAISNRTPRQRIQATTACGRLRRLSPVQRVLNHPCRPQHLQRIGRNGCPDCQCAILVLQGPGVLVERQQQLTADNAKQEHQRHRRATQTGCWRCHDCCSCTYWRLISICDANEPLQRRCWGCTVPWQLLIAWLVCWRAVSLRDGVCVVLRGSTSNGCRVCLRDSFSCGMSEYTSAVSHIACGQPTSALNLCVSLGWKKCVPLQLTPFHLQMIINISCLQTHVA